MPAPTWYLSCGRFRRKNEVHQALLRAVRSGRITKARLHQSLRRILRVKQRRGILNQKLKPVAQTLAELKQGQHRQVVSEIADQAITVVKTPKKNLPLRSDKKYVVASTEPAFMRQLNKKLPNSSQSGFGWARQRNEKIRWRSKLWLQLPTVTK